MKESVLRVGLDYAAPIPLHTDISSDKFEGFEVDLVNQIAEELGLKLQYSVALWKEIINDLIEGEIDAICSAATVTDERKKKVAFSEAYLSFHLCVVCRADKLLKSKDLANEVVGVRASTEAEEYLKSNYPGKRLHIFDSNEEQYKSLAHKKVDALIDDSPIAYGFTSKNHLLVTSELIRGTSSQYAIILNRSDNYLKSKIDMVINELKESGFIERKKLEWFKNAEL